MRTRRSTAGVTLMELVIAITLLSLLSLGMLMAMRVGLSAFAKTNTRLMDNRRVAGAQRILEQQVEGLVPVMGVCGATPEAQTGPKYAIFQGEAAAMRLVSTFSLQEASRGQPQILELFVIPGEEGRGVRLVVNEIPYTGPASAGQLCTVRTPDPATGTLLPVFLPMTPGPRSFVLADQLAYCRFSYLTPGGPPNQPDRPPPAWRAHWTSAGWPWGVRIEMAPLVPDPARVQPITAVAPIYLSRQPELPYDDRQQ
ncbi:MAG: hypothetical protein LAP87_18500 [Acidobacteriia bacterium]|nr:hypothetical protein [Terriglobia bacterium]